MKVEGMRKAEEIGIGDKGVIYLRRLDKGLFGKGDYVYSPFVNVDDADVIQLRALLEGMELGINSLIRNLLNVSGKRVVRQYAYQRGPLERGSCLELSSGETLERVSHSSGFVYTLLSGGDVYCDVYVLKHGMIYSSIGNLLRGKISERKHEEAFYAYLDDIDFRRVEDVIANEAGRSTLFDSSEYRDLSLDRMFLSRKIGLDLSSHMPLPRDLGEACIAVYSSGKRKYNLEVPERDTSSIIRSILSKSPNKLSEELKIFLLSSEKKEKLSTMEITRKILEESGLHVDVCLEGNSLKPRDPASVNIFLPTNAVVSFRAAGYDLSFAVPSQFAISFGMIHDNTSIKIKEHVMPTEKRDGQYTD